MTKNNHPVHLWISDTTTVHKKMIDYLQQEFCTHQRCLQCITCKQIAAKEFASATWFTPERSYTVDDIDEIIHATSFQLDPKEKIYIIIDQAERLTEQAANKLLKTIEEPFPGYYFFFLTNRQQSLPLTIQSRCIITKFKNESTIKTYQEFVQPFIDLRFYDPINFIKKLETLDIKEQETKEIIDDLFEHWTKITKQEIIQSGTISLEKQKIIAILRDGIQNPPMTGSAKIFWKNIYLNMHYATTHS
jgi:DNA polymerase III delta prime subunit